MGTVYPELPANAAKIIETIGDEESSFGRTLDRGVHGRQRSLLRAPEHSARKSAQNADRDDRGAGHGLQRHPTARLEQANRQRSRDDGCQGRGSARPKPTPHGRGRQIADQR